MPYSLGQEASWEGSHSSSEPWDGLGAALRCLDPSSVPILLTELSMSPEASPAVAETAALSIPALLLLTLPPSPLSPLVTQP